MKQKSRKRNINRDKRRKLNEKKRKASRQTCAGSVVGEICLLNAQTVLLFEANQVGNYDKQSIRMRNQVRQTGNKLAKRGDFAEAAKHLSMAVGGDMASPECGSKSASAAELAKFAEELVMIQSNYTQLNNCSIAITEACTMSNETYNEAYVEGMNNCSKVQKDFKKLTKECLDNESNTVSSGQVELEETRRCTCWANAATAMEDLKAAKCDHKGRQKAVKEAKNVCVEVFKKCKKMEDMSHYLVHECMDDHSMKLLNQTGKGLHEHAMEHAKEAAAKEAAAKEGRGEVNWIIS